MSGVCNPALEGLSRLGYVPIKHGGKFSLTKTLSFESFRTYRTETLQVQVSGALKVGKSLVGKVKFTTVEPGMRLGNGRQQIVRDEVPGPHLRGVRISARPSPPGARLGRARRVTGRALLR